MRPDPYAADFGRTDHNSTILSPALGMSTLFLAIQGAMCIVKFAQTVLKSANFVGTNLPRWPQLVKDLVAPYYSANI